MHLNVQLMKLEMQSLSQQHKAIPKNCSLSCFWCLYLCCVLIKLLPHQILCSATPSGSSELWLPPYSRHTVVVSIVSALERFCCLTIYCITSYLQERYRIYSNGRRILFSSHPWWWAKGNSSRPWMDAGFNYIRNTFRGCGDKSMRACLLVPACKCMVW